MYVIILLILLSFLTGLKCETDTCRSVVPSVNRNGQPPSGNILDEHSTNGSAPPPLPSKETVSPSVPISPRPPLPADSQFEHDACKPIVSPLSNNDQSFYKDTLNTIPEHSTNGTVPPPLPPKKTTSPSVPIISQLPPPPVQKYSSVLRKDKVTKIGMPDEAPIQLPKRTLPQLSMRAADSALDKVEILLGKDGVYEEEESCTFKFGLPPPHTNINAVPFLQLEKSDNEESSLKNTTYNSLVQVSQPPETSDRVSFKNGKVPILIPPWKSVPVQSKPMKIDEGNDNFPPPLSERRSFLSVANTKSQKFVKGSSVIEDEYVLVRNDHDKKFIGRPSTVAEKHVSVSSDNKKSVRKPSVIAEKYISVRNNYSEGGISIFVSHPECIVDSSDEEDGCECNIYDDVIPVSSNASSTSSIDKIDEADGEGLSAKTSSDRNSIDNSSDIAVSQLLMQEPTQKLPPLQIKQLKCSSPSLSKPSSAPPTVGMAVAPLPASSIGKSTSSNAMPLLFNEPVTSIYHQIGFPPLQKTTQQVLIRY